MIYRNLKKLDVSIVLTLLFSITVLLVTLTVYSQPGTKTPVSVKRAKHIIRMGSIVPNNSLWASYFKARVRRIKRSTYGNVKFKFSLGGSLGSEAAMINLLQKGKLEAFGGTLTSLAHALDAPELLVMELPYLFKSQKEVDYIVDEIIVGEFDKIFKKHNLVLLQLVDSGWCLFASRHNPLDTVKSFENLRVRSPQSILYSEMYKSLGAFPITIAATEVLSSLQSGSIDALDGTPAFLFSAGWYPTMKYITLSQHIYQVAAIVLRRDYFEQLPQKYRTLLLENRKQETQLSRKIIKDNEKKIFNIFKKAGMKMVEQPSTVRNRMHLKIAPVYKKFRESGAYSPIILDKVNNALKAFRKK